MMSWHSEGFSIEAEREVILTAFAEQIQANVVKNFFICQLIVHVRQCALL